jgi:hypothetical protein
MGAARNTLSPLPPLPFQGGGGAEHWAHRRAPLHPHTTTGVRGMGAARRNIACNVSSPCPELDKGARGMKLYMALFKCMTET